NNKAQQKNGQRQEIVTGPAGNASTQQPAGNPSTQQRPVSTSNSTTQTRITHSPSTKPYLDMQVPPPKEMLDSSDEARNAVQASMGRVGESAWAARIQREMKGRTRSVFDWYRPQDPRVASVKMLGECIAKLGA
ncbi:hypothetical protein HDU67_001523, partial [Dinochytrium kinnereticum]